MSRFSLTHLADDTLLREVPRLLATERHSTAALLAALAEVDSRRLYAPRGYASMHAWCVGELRLAPDVAAKRIQAARAVRDFPALLQAIDDGRLNVTAVVLLAPHLTEGNLAEMVAMATGLTQLDLRAVLTQRFPAPQPNAVSLHLDAASGSEPTQMVTDRSQEQDSNPVAPASARETREATVPLSPPATPAPPAAPARFPLPLMVTQDFREKLAYARDLLGHAVPGGDTVEVLARALDALIVVTEKRRFGVGSRTRPVRRARRADERSISLAIRREVFQRDAGRCTFVGDDGHRCESRARLEIDHVVPIARGGTSTASNLRLRCRTHNQLEAERVFGAGFVRAKRAVRAATAAEPPASGRPAPAA